MVSLHLEAFLDIIKEEISKRYAIQTPQRLPPLSKQHCMISSQLRYANMLFNIRSFQTDFDVEVSNSP